MVALGLLLSADNGVRSAAEAELERLKLENPALVAVTLVDTLTQPADADEAERSIAVVLARRVIPVILPRLPSDAVARVKAGLLQALSVDYSPAMRRKLCDTVGRLAAEFQAHGMWPELNAFVEGACSGNDPRAHESALAILEHMAPALLSTWSACGAAVLAMCASGLGSAEESVRSTGLSTLTALLRTCADLEAMASNSSERKAYKAIAAQLGGALPRCVDVLEALVGRGDGSATRTQAALKPRLHCRFIGVTSP